MNGSTVNRRTGRGRLVPCLFVVLLTAGMVLGSTTFAGAAKEPLDARFVEAAESFLNDAMYVLFVSPYSSEDAVFAESNVRAGEDLLLRIKALGRAFKSSKGSRAGLDGLERELGVLETKVDKVVAFRKTFMVSLQSGSDPTLLACAADMPGLLHGTVNNLSTENSAMQGLSSFKSDLSSELLAFRKTFSQ